MKASLTFAEMAAIRRARPNAQQVFKQIIAAAKSRFNIPVKHRLRVEVDDQRLPKFAVLIRKRNGQHYSADSQTLPKTFCKVPADTVNRVLAVSAGTRASKVPKGAKALEVRDGHVIVNLNGEMGKIEARQAWQALQDYLKRNPPIECRKFNDLPGVSQQTGESVQAGVNGWRDGDTLWIPI